MTTIAASAKGTLATDRQFTSDVKMAGRKINSADDAELGRIVFATAGLTLECARFERWIVAGRKGRAPSTNAVECLVLLHDTRTMELWESSRGVLVRTECREPHWAIGTGASYAIAYMDMGLSPRSAVLRTSKRDANTGKGVDTVRVWR